MNNSISRRIFKTFFLFNIVSMLLLYLVAWHGLETLEETMLEIDKKAGIDQFSNMQKTDQVIHLKTATLNIFYIPDLLRGDYALPVIFEGLPIPYSGEVEILEQSYNVTIERINHGTYFYAKDMTLYEEHEIVIESSMIALMIGIILFSALIAWLAGKMISKPMTQLTDDITKSAESGTTVRLSENFKDKELINISKAINHYFDEIDNLVAREKNMMVMASHELKTPIAVILGATEVILSRNQLEENDRKTVMRIVSSAKEMTDNVQSLLELFRNTLNHKLDQTITLNSLLKTIHSEFILAHASYRERIQLASNLTNTTLNANPTLVKMLINNLLMNALKHTQGDVLLSCQSDHLDVQDKGQWKNLSDIKIGHPIESEISSGLGLYIVSLICKHLDWRLDIQSQEEGTSIKVWFT